MKVKSKKSTWLNTIVRSLESKLISYANSFVKNLEVAKEIVQETFIRFLDADYDEIKDNVNPWLYRVCRNLCIDHLRRVKTRQDKEEDVKEVLSEQNSSLEDQLHNKERIKKIKIAINQLNDKEREIMNLKFKQELSYKEISEITGETVNYIGVTLHNIVKKLQSLRAQT